MTENERNGRLWRIGTFLVLIGMLVAIGSALADRLERRADKTIREALDREGLAWVKVEMEGRTARLTGQRSALGEGSVALTVAREAECPLFILTVPCAARVSADFGELEPSRGIDTDL